MNTYTLLNILYIKHTGDVIHIFINRNRNAKLDAQSVEPFRVWSIEGKLNVDNQKRGKRREKRKEERERRGLMINTQ